MAQFNAAKAVDPININLKPYVDLETTIPEPSTKAMTEFQNVLVSMAKELNIKPGQQMDLAAMAEMPEDAANVIADKMQAAIIGLCGGAITDAHLDALPFRVKIAFITWLTGEISPEASTPGTNR